MRFFPHTIFAAVLFLICVTAHAQDDWDKVLDRYENICKSCIEMRAAIVQGEGVPDSRVTEMLGELGKLRTQLQKASNNMTYAQKRRFNSIRSSYDNNGTPKPAATRKAAKQKDTVAVAPIHREFGLPPLPPIKGGPPPVWASTAYGLPERPAFPSGFQSLPKSEYGTYRFDIMAAIDFNPRPACGMIAAVSRQHWGAYLSIRSNFIAANTLYVTTSDGNISTGGKFWGNGSSRYSCFYATGGAIWRPWGDSVGFLLGAGYGDSCVAWQDIKGDWARVYDLSSRGLTAEAGVMYTWKHISILAGMRIKKAPSAILAAGFSF